MYDLLKKLNTLVSAQVNDLASRLPNIERKPDLDRQVAELRQRVAAALEHEDRLRAQVNALQQEIAGLDARIDAAIQVGHETTARGLLDETQRLQKRLALAESDLRQHQNAAADLIIRVNELESAVGDLKASNAAPPAPRGVPADAPKGAVTDFMPPAASEPIFSAGTASPKTPLAEGPVPDPTTPAAPVDDPPMETAEPVPPTPAPPASQPEAPAQPEQPAQPERKPWDKPRTAKEAAEWAREDAEQTSERASTGVEQVGGLLRDIQARVSQRMSDLDRMLAEGGLTDEPAASAAPSDKPKTRTDDDLNDRLSRLAKPDGPDSVSQ